jgi:hypothetical protein
MARARSTRKWSGNVTETSDALVLEPRVFRGQDPKRIAVSQTVGVARPSSQSKPVPIGNVYAEFLYQPRREEFVGSPETDA